MVKTHLGEFCRYTSLNVLGMIGISCYILADTFFVANGLGSDGLAALNIAIPAFSLIQGTGLMLGIGGATRYSIAKSQGLNEESNRAFTHSLYFGAIFAVIYMLMGIFLSTPIATLLGADNDTFEMCKSYLQVLMIFSPAFIANNIILAFVRNDGAPQLSMTAMIAGSIFNIIFDYVFIFPMGMGIFGAALATGFSPIVSLLILSVFFIKKHNKFKPIRCKLSLKFSLKIMSVGIPSLVTEISSGIVIFVFNIIMLQLLGNIGVAAYGIIANISIVVISIFTGISQGIQPLVSKYYGLNDRKTVNTVLRYSLIASIIISIVVYGCLFMFSSPIVSAFNSENDAALQAAAINGLNIYFTGILFAGMNIILAAYFAATDKARPASTISILRGFIVIIPLAILLANIFGINGLWISFPLAELTVSLVSFIILYIQHKASHKSF